MEPIVKLGKKMFLEEKERRGPFPFVPDKKANDLLNDIAKNPHVFVLGCLMDRQIKAEKAWMIPQEVFKVLGTSDFNELQKEPEKKFIEIFNDNNLHRFNDTMANIFYSGIQDIKTEYHGNAAEIWNGKPSSKSVVRRFREFKGCGQKIATMAANILVRHLKVEFSDLRSIDISTDTHIMRVMQRMGYVPIAASRTKVIAKARELYPEYPGIIDLPCFTIGRKWCHSNNPECNECDLKECKRRI
jgi:endonuclease III